jgi:hypothetical protein
MAIGIFVLAGALVVLVAALVLLVAGKGAVRWVGLSILLIVLGGASMLFIGASRTASSISGASSGLPEDSFRDMVPGGAILVVAGEVSGSGVLSNLTPALDQRLASAGIRGDDLAVFGGAGGDHSFWFQSRMFGSSGTMEFFQEFSIVEGTTTQAVRSTVQAALFEALGTEDTHGLEGVQIDLRLWHVGAEEPEAWKLTATESELSWEPSDSLGLFSPDDDPGFAPAEESTSVEVGPEDEPSSITGG